MQEEIDQITEQKSRFSASFRASVLIILIVISFIVAKQFAKPKSFGEFGFYRGDNVAEWIAMDQNYAPPGNKTCSKCHDKIVQLISQGEHSKLDCQSCHGSLMAHVLKPNVPIPKVLGNAELCGTCHREIVGRTKEQIATVKVGEHSGGLDCVRCHDSHQPLPVKGG
ncbi:MAG: hypothetical protein WA131_00335 [Desulfitobacteriaceae bacterium]